MTPGIRSSEGQQSASILVPRTSFRGGASAATDHMIPFAPVTRSRLGETREHDARRTCFTNLQTCAASAWSHGERLVTPLITRVRLSLLVLQYVCSLLLIFCVELSSAVWTYDQVTTHRVCLTCGAHRNTPSAGETYMNTWINGE